MPKNRGERVGNFVGHFCRIIVDIKIKLKS